MTALALIALTGCGSSRPTAGAGDRGGGGPVSTSSSSVPHADPQVVEPSAGQGAARGSRASPGGGSGRARSTRNGDGSTAASPPSLNQPASVTRAPAKGAPTTAQVQAAVERLKAVTTRYHLDRLSFSGALINLSRLPPGPYQTSIASFYDDYDQGIACGGVLHPSTLGVANKTLPCGTEVIFIYGNRAIRVPVIDRGPYIAGRTWDLTGATAVALHFPGLGPIQWRLSP